MPTKWFKINDRRYINRDLVAEAILHGSSELWSVTFYFQAVTDNGQIEATANFNTEEDARLCLERFIQG